MSNGVSVVICCHNSASRLPETLRHLALQKVPDGLPWEIVVIDNASTDDTAATAARCWPASARAELRVISESEAGLSHARIRGIREARHDVISFIDDDNWASPDWIERVHAIFTSHPEVAASGGRIEGVYETTPPAWFESLHGSFAVGPQHARSGDITEAAGTLLCGAGLSLRATYVRQLFQDGFTFRMTGRKGNSLLSGEDTELCFALRASGWRLWYDDDLVLSHFMPTSRLQWDYVRRLMWGNGQSSVYFDLYLTALNQFPYIDRPEWQNGWFYAELRTMRCILPVLLLHPVACIRQPEGSMPCLSILHACGRFSALWALRGEYDQLLAQVANSAWVRATGKSPTPTK